MISLAVHVQIELVGAEMLVKLSNSVKHIVSLLCVTILLSLKEFCELNLERLEVWNWCHGHKYICA